MRHFKQFAAVLILFAGVASGTMAKTEVSKQSGGKLPDGTAVEIYTLKDEKIEARIMTYGGDIISLKAPDRAGKVEDVVLGFDDPAGYYENMHSKSAAFFGPIVGRYANRIAHAKFTLDGKEYTLTKNNGENTLHGGPNGFHNHNWAGKVIADGVELKYLSKDGEEGYPGNCKVTVIYHLTDADELRIDYAASTDKDTVVNLTNHSYFNLKGGGDILGHQLTLNAETFTPVDSGLIPTGELKPVVGTPFDFRKPTVIGARIEQGDEQLKLGKGYDHNWVLNKKGSELSLAARVEEPETGRVMEVWTTQPGIQFYTGNFLDGTIKGKGGTVYARRSALCLETQHFPDSPNKPKFPSAVLRPGMDFKSTTVYKFVK